MYHLRSVGFDESRCDDDYDDRGNVDDNDDDDNDDDWMNDGVISRTIKEDRSIYFVNVARSATRYLAQNAFAADALLRHAHLQKMATNIS